MKMRNLLLSAMMLIFASLAIANNEITSGVDANGVVHVRVWDLAQSAGKSPSSAASWAILKAFEKKYPNIKLHSASGLELPGVGNKMDIGPLMAISGGIAPDVLYVNFRKSASYIDNEFLYPLDEYIDEYTKKVGKKEAQYLINPALMKVVNRYGPIKGKKVKKIWMIPQEPVVMTMIYRKDLFAKCGLDPNKPPKNWDEMLAYAKQLTNFEKETYGLTAVTTATASWHFMTYLSSTGTKVVTEDKNGVWRATFAQKEAIPALKFYSELVAGLHEDGHTRGFSTNDGKAREEGRVGMFFAYLGGDEVSRLDTSGTNFGFAPVPKGPSGKSSAEINAKMQGIYRGQTDDRVRRAAFKWLAFNRSTEAVKITVDTYIKRNSIQSINPLLLDRLGKEYDKYRPFVNQDLLKLYKNLVKNATPEPYGKNCDLIYDYLDAPVQAAILWRRDGNFETHTEAEIDAKMLEFLKEGQLKAEIEMLDNLPPEERTFRNRVAIVVTSIIFIVFAVLFWQVTKVLTPEHERGKGFQFLKYWRPYLILIPAVGSIIIWKYYPLARGSLMAFQDYKIAVPVVDWVGFDNFAAVIFDGAFWYSIWLSFYYSALVIAFTWLPPVMLAIMLSEIPKFTVFFRVVFYLPAVVSGLVVMFMWKQFFDPSPNGILNQFVMMLGADQQYWFEDPHLAMMCLIIPLAWSSLGPGCLIYLAALKGIPDDLYEAADIDGATYWNKVRHIVVPKLWPLLTINLIGQVIIGFNAAENVLAMTGGGPNGATLVTGLLIFKKAFVYTKYGPATAMAWMMSIFLIGFTVHQLKILSRLEFKTTGDK